MVFDIQDCDSIFHSLTADYGQMQELHSQLSNCGKFQFSGLVLSWWFFCTSRSFVGYENTGRWIVHCYKFYCFWQYCVSKLSLHIVRVYWLTSICEFATVGESGNISMPLHAVVVNINRDQILKHIFEVSLSKLHWWILCESCLYGNHTSYHNILFCK